MTKFTREASFEFEGMRVWPSENVRGSLIILGADGQWAVSEAELRAIEAFIEAERNEWAWTNDEHTEARKGRWTVMYEGDSGWRVRHDDFGECALVSSDTQADKRLRWKVPGAVYGVLDDFLAWRAAQNQPAEPTGEGFVGTLDTDDEVFHVYRNTSFAEWPFTWVSTLTGAAQVGVWEDVCELGEFRP